MKIVPVDTMQDALNYLNKLKESIIKEQPANQAFFSIEMKRVRSLHHIESVMF